MLPISFISTYDNMSETVMTNKSATPAVDGQETLGGASMMPPELSLIASAGSGLGNNPGGNGDDGGMQANMEADQGTLIASSRANTSPFWGLINAGGVPLRSRPAPQSAPHSPLMEAGEGVQVLRWVEGDWYEVTRTVNYSTQRGYVAASRVSRTPGRIGGSTRRPGMQTNGTQIANDLTYGQWTKKQITNLHPLMNIQANMPEESNWLDFYAMSNLIFASGDLATNINQMIGHFRGNTGADYSSPILESAVANHASMREFVSNTGKAFYDKLATVSGNANRLRGAELQQIARPIFNEASDIWRGGLTIAINDVWAYDIDMVKYDREGDNYQATLRLTLWDHFGLDRPDLEKIYVNAAGFRAWFVLQHMDEYGYKPFKVKIPLTYTFSGHLRGGPSHFTQVASAEAPSSDPQLASVPEQKGGAGTA
jgi:Protein of unknown function (DUF3289)